MTRTVSQAEVPETVSEARLVDRMTGLLICAVLAGTVLLRWGAGWAWLPWATGIAFVAAIALMVPRVRWGRRAFVVVATILTLAAATRGEAGLAAMGTATLLAAFVASFFSALSTLGKAAESSPAIHRAGQFLAVQPPGRRYAALTLGGQLFSLVLNYGSIQLLGSLAIASLSRDGDERVRKIRTRRMLLAIERALVSTLTWSPLTYSVTMVTLLVPGVVWGAVLLPGLVSGAILAATGWAMDALSAPRRRSGAVRRHEARGSWRDLLPLLFLLFLLGSVVFTIFRLLQIQVPGIVIAVVPVLSVLWLLIQARGRADPGETGRRISRYVFTQLPDMRSEIVLLSMAGYIGSIGSFLFRPFAETIAPALMSAPGWAILSGLIWLIVATGQIGMNPLLTVTLIVPALPPVQDLGIGQTSMFLALTAGWALNGISTPFSAMAVILGRFSGADPRTVCLKWNGPYTLAAGALLTAWVLFFNAVLETG